MNKKEKLEAPASANNSIEQTKNSTNSKNRSAEQDVQKMNVVMQLVCW